MTPSDVTMANNAPGVVTGTHDTDFLAHFYLRATLCDRDPHQTRSSHETVRIAL